MKIITITLALVMAFAQFATAETIHGLREPEEWQAPHCRCAWSVQGGPGSCDLVEL